MSLVTKPFGELKIKLSSSLVLKFTKFDKTFEVKLTGASKFAIGGLLMQDGWPLHEGRWLSKETANSWETTLHVSTLFGYVAILFGVAQSKDLHAQCVLEVFWNKSASELQAMWWHNTLAVMKVDLFCKPGQMC